MPVAPGTWGSLPPVVAFALLAYSNVSGTVIAAVMAAFVVAASVACVALVPAVAALAGKTDPSEVVVDEVAGQAVTFLIAALVLPGDLSLGQVCLVAGVGLFLFRVLDITKPWPIRKLEALPEGWGVLADDLLAGLFAAVVLCMCIRLWVTV
jgi:phosphatidylglycerophosphatase A